MKKVLLTLACVFSILLLASCSGKGTYKFATSTVGTTRSTATVYYTLEDSNNEITSSLYAKICNKGKTTAVNSTAVKYDSESTTGNYVTFEKLTKDTEYDIIFYATFNKKKVDLAKVSVKTSIKGTEEDPYVITKYEEFSTMLAKDSSGYYKLGNDIDFGGNGLEPLFSSSSSFTGSFDGDNHKITNFSLATAKTETVDGAEKTTYSGLHLSTNYAGIFGYIAANGEVKNLTIEGARYNVYRGSKSYMGLIAGYNAGTISNVNLVDCDITLSVTSSSALAAGALVGWNAAGGKITDCSTSGKLTVSGKTELRVGSICGTNGETSKNKSTVSNCVSTLAITAENAGTSSSSTDTTSYIGGIVGENIFTLSGCGFNGSISYKSSMSSTVLKTYAINVGGLVGGSVADAAIINTSAAKSTITIESADALLINVGSLVGLHGSTVAPAYATLKKSIGEAAITVNAGLTTVNCNGAVGIDNIDYTSISKQYFAGTNTTCAISYKEEVENKTTDPETGEEKTEKVKEDKTKNLTSADFTEVKNFVTSTMAADYGITEKVSNLFN